MPEPEDETTRMTPEANWRTIHETINQSRSSMYLAGTSSILLLWGAVAATGFLGMFLIERLASDFVDENPWYPGPLWVVLAVIGFIGSGIIGNRASQHITDNSSTRSAGFKVFLFFLAVVVSAFAVPAASGLWGPDTAAAIPGVTIGIVSLGYILFGIMTRPVVAIIGLAFAAAYYIPAWLLDDLAFAVTAVAILAIVFGGAIWLRKSGAA